MKKEEKEAAVQNAKIQGGEEDQFERDKNLRKELNAYKKRKNK